MSRYTTHLDEDEPLPNKLGLTDTDKINEEELVGFVRAEQDAIDALEEHTTFSLDYLYDLHRKALGDLYTFAGKLRTVNMSKGKFSFPSAEFLPENMQEFEKTFLDPINTKTWEDDTTFLQHLAAMHAELLYIHPFREGNGRVVRLFTKLISLVRRGKDIEFDLINKNGNFERYVAAVQQAGRGEHTLMQELFVDMET
jgi:cell filamentation protein